MALEKTFKSAFGNDAKYFARWGIAYFAFSFAAFALASWELMEVLRHGAISPETKQSQTVIKRPLAIGMIVVFAGSAYEFLRRIYRVRKFLVERGKLQFPDWPLTVIACAIPIVQFFVPWNRFDAIRQALRMHRDTGAFAMPSKPEKKLRALGIIWGLASLYTVTGQSEDATWMSAVLIGGLITEAMLAWTFYIAARWLSELQSDFEAVTLAA